MFPALQQRRTVTFTDHERIALLRAALSDLRPRLPTLPDRQHVDEILRLTDPHVSLSRPVQPHLR